MWRFIGQHKNPFILLLVLILATTVYAADTLLKDMTVATSAGADDIFYMVNDPNGTPGNRKIGFEELMLSITKTGTIATGVWHGSDIALTTYTSGNYAAGDGEAGNALTGDSATAFFSSGTIEHEYGGLEANVSAYSGLVAIAAGATAEVDALSELIAQLADVTAFITDDDMPAVATDPDIDAAGEIGRDSDGANETGDSSLRGYDGANQFSYARKLQRLCGVNVIKPNDLADATRDKCMIGHNNSGMTYTVVQILAWSDTDDTDFTVLEFDEDGASNQATVDACQCTVGTGPYTEEQTTITGATIEAGHTIWVDFDDTDAPGYVFIEVWGWYNANVD